MTPRERELLRGIGNCYDACRASFEDTVEMVGSSRGLTAEEVKAMLRRVRENHAHDEEYRVLRSRLPEEFPL
ncbi:MAG: hypothetical protein ACE5KH_06795 [Candidatus Geothermarchaeales archaeon]